MSKRTSVSVSPKSLDLLRRMQASYERKLGFAPSLAQIVESVLKEHWDANKDVMTASQSVDIK